jgi:excisionase family DNA binding protein
MLDNATMEQLASLIADRVAMKLANRPIAKAPQTPVGALSKVDAASYLGVSTRTVEKYIATGKLAAVKQGTKVTLLVSDLDTLLAKMQSA